MANVLWNVVAPVNLMETQRIIGELEYATVNTLLEVVFRKLFGLKAEWVETLLAKNFQSSCQIFPKECF